MTSDTTEPDELLEHDVLWLNRQVREADQVRDWNSFCPPVLIEFATRQDSAIGEAGDKCGVRVLRMTKECPDVSTSVGE